MISFQSSPTEKMMVVYQFDIVFMHKERYNTWVGVLLNIESVLKFTDFEISHGEREGAAQEDFR